MGARGRAEEIYEGFLGRELVRSEGDESEAFEHLIAAHQGLEAELRVIRADLQTLDTLRAGAMGSEVMQDPALSALLGELDRGGGLARRYVFGGEIGRGGHHSGSDRARRPAWNALLSRA